MEAAVASGILKIVGNKLAPLLMNEYSSIVGAENDLQELHGQVLEINSWLESVGDKAVGNDPSFNWLKVLKYIAYEVDDIVDEFQLKAAKHETGGDGGIVSKYLWNKPKSIILQCKLATKIKAIKKKFAAVVRQRNDFSTITNSLPVGHPVRHTNMTVGEMALLPNIDVASVLGRDKDKHELISKLVEVKDQQTINIVSIIGLGGSGKTTLAKLVFNDGNIIDKHFEVKLWLHVSEEFVIEKLVGKLFEAIAGEKSEQYPLQQMSKTILDNLTRKRYLLVLDDVWTKDKILWDQFMVHLKSGTPGSAILLTMRSNEVARTVRSTYQFGLPLLSLGDSWQLFQQSLGMPVEYLESEFLDVGKEIVNKCGGVPLAIKVIAGVLSGKELIGQWQAMRDSNLLDVEDEKASVSVFACLRLSYFHLPSHMKQCFTICSVFPKGYMIDKEQLIDLWIAHDMITTEAGVEYLEYIGHKYFDSLVQISFLQDVAENRYGRVECRMHDLVHDLALSILGDEISTYVLDQKCTGRNRYRYFSLSDSFGLRNTVPDIFKKARAIYVARGDSLVSGKALKNATNLRSITINNMFTHSVPDAVLQIKYLRFLSITGLNLETLPQAISNIWSLQALHVNSPSLSELPGSIGKLKKLRTLNLSGCSELVSLPDSVSDCDMISSLDLCYCENLTALPSSIGKAKRLREIRLGLTKIERLPDSIVALGNLECLDLWCCHALVELPGGIRNLNRLEGLNLDGCNGMGSMPVGIGQLSRLKKLGLFIVGEDEQSAKISELGNISRISGELTVRNIPYGMNPNDAYKACLRLMTNLDMLTLNWRSTKKVDPEKELAVLDGLEPPPGIKCLEIHGYAGSRYTRWMQKQVVRVHGRFELGVRVHSLCQFASLTTMTLSDFPNLECLDGLMELPCLEELKLLGMPALESVSGGAFPSLAKLRMERLPRLGEVWMFTERTLADGEDNTSQLGELQIGNCLSDLWIKECPRVKLMPYFPSSLECLVIHLSNEQLLLLPGQGQVKELASALSFSHLKKLELSGLTTPSSPGLGSGYGGWELLQQLTALESLQIHKCNGLTELPECTRSLRSLRSLHIEGCSALGKLPEWLGDLCSLQKMTIRMCKILSSLPTSVQHLTTIQILSISDCDAFHQLPAWLGDLGSLQTLELRGLRSLSSLPESLVHLTSLQELEIRCCTALDRLPEQLGELRSLRTFEISSLPWLSCLPKSMRRLTSLKELWIRDCPRLTRMPVWMRDLTDLRELHIIHCPDLEWRCKSDKGEDWHLVSHIPHLSIQ